MLKQEPIHKSLNEYMYYTILHICTVGPLFAYVYALLINLSNAELGFLHCLYGGDSINRTRAS